MRSDPLFELSLSKNEHPAFMACLPLIELGATAKEKSKALYIIGLDNPLIFDLIKQHDYTLLNAFRVVLFAMNLKDSPTALDAFIGRMNFRNRGFERRFLKYFDLNHGLSVNELNAMWELKSEYDDGGEPITE